MNAPPVILLMGPTASGKTDTALRLADHFPLEFISVDSAQIFQDMNIGTAKPEASILARYPHALIDILSPEGHYSAARFRTDALNEIERIIRLGKIPLLVGGTMLYYKALLDGLATLPEASPEVRQAIDAYARAHGWPAIHRELMKVDPVTAARLSPTDPQRLQRAFEIYQLTGRPMSALLAETQGEKPPYRFISIGLMPSDRARLHAQIARRFQSMLKAGLEAELSALKERYTLHADLPAMRTVGYRQVWEMQAGHIPRAELEMRGIAATRQLAKRQITWMNNTLRPTSFDPFDPNSQGLLETYLTEALKHTPPAP